MTEKAVEIGLDRRQFLRTAAATAVAAAATGSGAALLLKEKEGATIALPPPPIPQPVQIAGNAAADTRIADLLAKLTSVQAENIRLQAELGASERRLEAARSENLQKQDAGAQAWQAQLDEANARAEALNGQVSILSGLVALYEQLDDVDLAQVIQGGFSAVDGLFDALGDQLPSVNEGLQMGQQALSEFEEQVPLVDAGQQWLVERMESLSTLHEVLETAISNAVESGGTFLQLLNEWFQDILKWLPFGLGKKAESIMSAMSDLLDETPKTVGGAQQKVVQPLDVWLFKEGGETRVQRQLVKPIREQAIEPAAQALAKIDALQITYQGSLVGPVNVSADQKQQIRDTITRYRQSYQL